MLHFGCDKLNSGFVVEYNTERDKECEQHACATMDELAVHFERFQAAVQAKPKKNKKTKKIV